MRACIAIALSFLSFLTPAATGAEGVLYDLLPGSALYRSCPTCRFAPLPLEGTFVLTPDPAGIDSQTFKITDIDIHASASSGQTDTITGTGTYAIIFPSLRSMTLDVFINDESPAMRLESSERGDAPPPFIDQTVTETQPDIITHSIRIDAAPRGTGEVTYELQKGSTFTDDCVACGRLVIPIPISGTFTLAKVDENPLFTTYRVDAIDFSDTAGDRGLRITGFGRYVFGGEVAITQDMRLDIQVNPAASGRSAVMASGTVGVTRKAPDVVIDLDEQDPASIGSVFRLRIDSVPRTTPPAPEFRRGDADASGKADLTDAVVILGYLFQGGKEPVCLDALDADDSGKIDLTDAVFLLGYLFLGGAEPPAPGPSACGPDPTPSPDFASPCVYPKCL